ncbi:MAG: Rrf2 family transcriptional regulator [Spirochaetes bacterium]|nr:Rrf2 family transcriptional regulator [Spirochaetota bacterium]
MKISTRSRYGLRLLIELADHDNTAPLFLSEIAKKQQVSEKYLSKLVISLRSCGFIKSVRGAHGGYLLAKSATEINLAQIIACLEGEFSFIDCTSCPETCDRSHDCASRMAWVGLEKVMKGYCEGLTLEAIRLNPDAPLPL